MTRSSARRPDEDGEPARGSGETMSRLSISSYYRGNAVTDFATGMAIRQPFLSLMHSTDWMI